MQSKENQTELHQWLDEALAALGQLAQTSLGFTEYAASKVIHAIPTRKLSGAYIPIFLEKEDLVIGCLSDPLGCEDLARGFLSMPTSALMPHDDMVDVMKELINMLAGLLKRERQATQPILGTSLPIFIDGMITPSPKQEMIAVPVATGGILLYLVVIREKIHSGAADDPLGKGLNARVSGNHWIEDLTGAASSLGERFINQDPPVQESLSRELDESGMLGVYVPMVGDQLGLLAGLVSDLAGFQEATAGYLNHPSGMDVGKSDAVETMKEILGIVSGALKQQMADHQITVRSGLPLFVEGCLDAGKEQGAWMAQLPGTLHPLYLIMLRKAPEMILQSGSGG